MMLEVARCLAQRTGDVRPKRSVAFVGFDLEERGLWGSHYFADHAPIPLDQLKLFLTADMIGRSLGGVCDEYVFVMGSEHSPAVRPWLDSAARGLPLRMGVVGSDMLLFDRSDYGPFRKRKIPYLFFSTGESPVYHTPDDRPETLDYPKLTAISTLVLGVVTEALRAESAPAWAPKAEHPLGEAVVVREVLERILRHADALKVGRVQVAWLKSQIDDLELAIKRGVLTPIERRRMLLNAQMIIYSVL
jgi:Zn-dependent M28 family amino/carboxypeptidase